MLISRTPKITENKITDNYSSFTIEPLEPGFGYTLGNSLRRTLLSTIPGAAITSIKIDQVKHEFSTIPGVRENVTQIMLNLKEVVFNSTVDEPAVLRIDKQGEGVITADDIVVPEGVEVVTPNVYIATLNEKGALNMELVVERGRGYVTAEQNKFMIKDDEGRIPFDSVYSPIVKVDYRVDPTRVEQRTDFDNLTIDVRTKANISPADAMASAASTLVELFWVVKTLNENAEGVEIIRDEEPVDFNEQSATASVDLSIPIEDLNLSIRSYNCLKHDGMRFLSDVIARSESDLANIRNFGKKSIDEVKSKLSELGLTLRDDNDAYDSIFMK